MRVCLFTGGDRKVIVDNGYLYVLFIAFICICIFFAASCEFAMITSSDILDGGGRGSFSLGESWLREEKRREEREYE